MNKPAYWDLLILEWSRIVTYEFWHDYGKPKHEEKAKLCYMDTGSFLVNIKTDYIYKGIAKDVETRFDTPIYELDRPVKVIGLMKDELGRKIMKKFVGLRAKIYIYLIGDGSEYKKTKSTKKWVIKRKHKFKDYKNCLKDIQLENKIKQLEKNKFNMKFKEKSIMNS